MPMPDRSRLRPAVVSVHYYPEYVERSIRHLRRICDRLQPERCVLVANNRAVLPALQEAAGRSAHAASVLLHDNSGLEFGAYQAGLDHLLAAGEPDWTVILNDTFAIHQCFSRPMRRHFVQAVTTIEDRDTPIVVGQVESLPRSFDLLGLRMHRWITTNAFAVNRGALRALSHRLRCAEPDELVPGSLASGSLLFGTSRSGAARAPRPLAFRSSRCTVVVPSRTARRAERAGAGTQGAEHPAGEIPVGAARGGRHDIR